MDEANQFKSKNAEKNEDNKKCKEDIKSPEGTETKVPETEDTKQSVAKTEVQRGETIRSLTVVPPIKKKFNVDALYCLYVCSVISGCTAEMLTFPLDLVKTRLQLQGETSDKFGASPKKGMVSTAVSIVKEEGFFKLWRGMSAMYVRHSIYSGVRMITYTKMKDIFVKGNQEKTIFPLWQAMTCGVVAGSVAQFASSPADLVKVQLQMEGRRKFLGLPPRVNGVFDAFIKIYRTGGVRGLFKGWVPAVQRAALVNVGDLAGYDTSKRFYQKRAGLPDKWPLHTLSSITAGFLGAVLSTPTDVIKSRIMNQPTDEKGNGLYYKGSVDCLIKAVKEEGVLSLYKGFIPTWIRLGPWALTFWITYEQLRIFLGGKTF